MGVVALQFSLTFDMNNAAFDEEPLMEAADIVKSVAVSLVEGRTSGDVHDINGNTVGVWSVTGSR